MGIAIFDPGFGKGGKFYVQICNLVMVKMTSKSYFYPTPSTPKGTEFYYVHVVVPG